MSRTLIILLAASLWTTRPLSAAVELGDDVVALHNFSELTGKKIGLITNPSGVNHELRSSIDILRQAPGVQLVALFGPEHGVYGTVGAGDKVDDATDKRTGLPVFSLYGKTRKPTPAMLHGLDALVYDVQDIGCRSYTFISTMGLAMEACAEEGVEFVVLDRPNPLGGMRVEGPMLDPRFRSFVSEWPVPYVYGLTCGELALMINSERWISKPCKLTIIRMQGWERRMGWTDTGLNWVPTSPKIQKAEAALYYAATGILGEIGANSLTPNFKLNFECGGPTWLETQKAHHRFTNMGLPGVVFIPYSTNFHRMTEQGLRVLFTDSNSSPLVAVNYFALDAAKKLSGHNIIEEAVNAHKDFTMFDKVNGTDRVRKALVAGESARRIVDSWKTDDETFRQKRKKYLLY